MDREELKAKFPFYFPIDELPEGAKEQDIAVYRICKWGRVEPKAFLTTYEENLYFKRNLKEQGDEITLDECSLSCYENLGDAQKLLDYFTQKEPGSILAKGVTTGIYGPSQRTHDRKPKRRPKSHVDWWLYADAAVHNEFREATENEDTTALF